MHFRELEMLIGRITIHPVRKIMGNLLTPYSAQEASLPISRFLAWFTVNKYPTRLWPEDPAYIPILRNILTKTPVKVRSYENL